MRETLRALSPWLGLWALILSVWDFCLMGFDKHRAKAGLWRVRERTFFLVALLGGAAGAVAGMFCFRHKTRHWYFRYGLSAILLAQIALAVWLA